MIKTIKQYLSDREKKKLDQRVNKIVRRFLPIGYWVFSDGEHLALFKEPSEITKKIVLKVGIKYKPFNSNN